LITVSHLAKHYFVHKRPPGVLAAIRSLLHRTKERVVAVEDLSFSIAAGERVGFLGPNGAGKTTTLKMLAGLLHPTSGEATVAGFTPRLRQAEFLRSIMLVTGQKQQLIWDLPPSETFELNRAIYDIPRSEFKATLDELVALLAIGELIDKPTRQLSLGERMKCELAAALLHRPKVLFLDEPTIGLDVTMQAAVRDFIRSYNERSGATVLLTSHYMDDVLALCPRVVVIDRGRLTYDGALEALVRDAKLEKHVTLRFSRAVERKDAEAIGGKVVSLDERSAVLQVEGGMVRDVVSRALAALPVEDLRVEDAPIEEVIADLFRKNARVAAEAAREGET
jgi:ABC-2 type transport system ATP-binding protein